MLKTGPRQAVYQSVFPTVVESDIPTPNATPLIGSGSFGPQTSAYQQQAADDPASQNIQWQRAWHATTSYLSIPHASIISGDASLDAKVSQNPWMPLCSAHVTEAISFIAQNASSSNTLGSHDGMRRVLDWYSKATTAHFIEFQLPILHKILRSSSQDQPLPEVVKLLQTSQIIYLHRIEHAILPHLKSNAQQELARFRDQLHALVSTSLSSSGLLEHLSLFLHSQCEVLFDTPETGDDKDNMMIDSSLEADKAIAAVRKVLVTLDDIGLGGAQVQQILAEAIDDGLSTYITKEYSIINSLKNNNRERICGWVDRRLAPLLANGISSLSSVETSMSVSWEELLSAQIENWKDRMVHDLGALRLEEMFDIIVDWQNNAPSGLHDLAPFVKTTAGRSFIISKFTTSVGNRLLQPGASTIEILQIYVHIIMAFLEMDAKGVLLDRISRTLRRYLRERIDTVKTIIQGLLLDTETKTEDGALEPIIDLARVLSELQEQQAPDIVIEEELYDIRWDPDPIDAAIEFKAAERAEIIGSLIDIFEHKEIFVKEFQNVLSERLLQADHELHREVQVLELFKKRIGESHMQACEVMLKDISDSRRIDEYVRRDQSKALAGNQLKAKILSRFYWPALEPEGFKIPQDICALQEKFAAEFEHYKPSRKLTWLNSLGRAKVELHLQDRIVKEEVHTWQATVIYAFANGDADGNQNSPVNKTLDQVVEELQMDEDMAAAALAFWVGKLVLQRDDDKYSVLETLPLQNQSMPSVNGQTGDVAVTAAATASAAAAASGIGSVRRSDEKVAEEKMAIFWQFIMNMLKNQGQMPLQKIVMMLKLVVQGGFPYSNDELKTFLAKKIEAGQLELVGGNYKVA